MADEGFKRKLTAILSADVEGYSRLMGEDEEATVRTLTAYREVLSTLIQQHNGKVLDSPGDNLLAEFVSVVDAVQCAVAVQKEINARNTELPENRRMRFRIGINLGDVIQEEERIYGDGVNIAARLEGLAEPGGICISKTAFDHIESKLPYGYDFIGDQTVKNIAKPVGAYRVLMEPRVTFSGKSADKKLAALRRMPILVSVVAVLVLAVGMGIWQFYIRRASINAASENKMAFPLPDKPSIAVLPFANMSGDPEQEYLSDGLTEEIISALSKLPKLFVIASNSSFTFKGRPVKAQQVSEELGVRYILEGSMRKDQNRIRITAQLVDATTGRHLWSERYDRDLKDIFALQDEITMKILTALEMNLTEGDQAFMMAKGTHNLTAYLKVLQATYYRRLGNVEDNVKARRLAKEAVMMDSNYAMAYSTLSRTHVMDVILRSTESPRKSLKTAIELAKKALSLDNSLADAYDILGNSLVWQKKYEEGLKQLERALELEPNGADISAHMGLALCFYDKPQEAIQALKKAIRLNPAPPGWYLYGLALSYNSIEKYAEAIIWGEKAVRGNPKDLTGHVVLCATYSLRGRMEEAHKEASEVLKVNPKYSVSRAEKTSPQKNPIIKKRFYDALRKAGLPE